MPDIRILFYHLIAVEMIEEIRDDFRFMLKLNISDLVK